MSSYSRPCRSKKSVCQGGPPSLLSTTSPALLEVASVEDSVQNRDGRPASDPPRWGNSSEPQTRRLLATASTATTSRRWTAFAWSNHWVRPAFGFNIQEIIDLFDSWGWVVNVFYGLEEDDK